MSESQFVAGAWGGKGLTAWLLGDGGEILDRTDSEIGLKSVPNRDFSGALRSACSSWLSRDPHMPFVLSGMVGARGGWQEVAYAECPLDLDQLVASAARVSADGSPVMLLPGAIYRRPDGHADVMRGEELQILGLATTLDIADAIVTIPGTHAKSAELQGGRLVRFRTYATGELFDLLIKNSLVGALAEGADFDRIAFGEGVARGCREALSHAIFAARASVLGDRMPPTSVASYLSGVLIGAELGDSPPVSAPRLLLASGLLAERYGLALESLGQTYRLVDAKTAALAGFRALATRSITVAA